MAAELILAPEVEQDLAEAYTWYESRRVGLGEDFLSRVDACIQAIRRLPEMHAVVHETYRRGLVRRFPYAVFYEYADDVVTVYCVPWNPAHLLLNDWAALAFLERVGGAPLLAPLLYGTDRDDGVIVMEDLGADDGPSTRDLLHGHDPARAEAALIDYIAAIGRLHAATMGQAAEYASIRGMLGAWPDPLPLFQGPGLPCGPAPPRLPRLRRRSTGIRRC